MAALKMARPAWYRVQRGQSFFHHLWCLCVFMHYDLVASKTIACYYKHSGTLKASIMIMPHTNHVTLTPSYLTPCDE